MIFGLIPVGGKGTRLSLPFSKEMIPQKNYDYYNPVINHTVEKMFLAGVSTIYMVHGSEPKKDIITFYSNNKNVVHLVQKVPSFSGVLETFRDEVTIADNDTILFGLPDSVYDNNPFVELNTISGLACGLFTCDDSTKVDRITIDSENTFQVKTTKNDSNSNWFWGVIKFDGSTLKALNIDNPEIGILLNRYNKTYVYGNKYIDLGTWEGYNRYLSDYTGSKNVEIEKKYDASSIDVNTFLSTIKTHFPEFNKYKYIPDTIDYYYTNNNQNIEFIRYRDGGKVPELAFPNVTIKNFNKTQFNRFELTLPIDAHIPKENILQFLTLLNCSFKFAVKVTCHIFYSSNSILVFYYFIVNDIKISIIELELNSSNYNIITEFEHKLNKLLPEFNPSKDIKVSKFQLISAMYDKNKFR